METRYLLPPEAYWSDDWYEREQDLLFSHTWHLVASEHELAVPGDFLTCTAGRDPLVVVRDLDGELRAFHNMCRHRGMQLLEGCGSTRTGIVCPYHFWNFGLDGALRKLPQPEQFPDLDLDAWGWSQRRSAPGAAWSSCTRTRGWTSPSGWASCRRTSARTGPSCSRRWCATSSMPAATGSSSSRTTSTCTTSGTCTPGRSVTTTTTASSGSSSTATG